jgi:hypothetical protein
MQHHGIPTRLLDWTETFSVALHFAIRDGNGNACIWMLNPYALNRHCYGSAELPHPSELEGDYETYFIAQRTKMKGKVIAISPLRHHPRVMTQRSAFTLHDDIDTPLDKICPAAVSRVVIPADARASASEYLHLAGVSEFSLFPDLDGLSRELRTEYF